MCTVSTVFLTSGVDAANGYFQLYLQIIKLNEEGQNVIMSQSKEKLYSSTVPRRWAGFFLRQIRSCLSHWFKHFQVNEHLGWVMALKCTAVLIAAKLGLLTLHYILYNCYSNSCKGFFRVIGMKCSLLLYALPGILAYHNMKQNHACDHFNPLHIKDV